MSDVRFIHLLYVPTTECSLRCSYCYLDEHPPITAADPVDTIAAIVEKLASARVVPFAISLHGGEVTCLKPDTFERLVAFIDRYYREQGDRIREAGFKPGRPHIKTNLYGIERHLDAIARYEVSVSGSIDVPFSLHDAYRRTPDGRPTLERILENLELLRNVPGRRKASATLFHEHVVRTDEIVRDLRFLHENTCLDMNAFNFMVGFSTQTQNKTRNALTPLSHDEQVAFYRRMHAEFDGTDLDAGVNGAWFAEFTPSYCTGCANCGEKFFLVDAQGDVFSCVRGQGHDAFCYGNFLRDPVDQVLDTARTKIFAAHNRKPLPDPCIACPYLRLCMTGCPFVKTVYGTGESYTCRLQQAIYRDHPDLYPPSSSPKHDAYLYARSMRPLQAESLRPAPTHALPRSVPSLASIIEADSDIAGVFDPDAFSIEIDGTRYPMLSQVLRPSRTIVSVSRNSTVRIYVRKDAFERACRWPVNNSLYLMLLSGDTVVYGDENREKQEHVVTHQVFFRTLASMPTDDDSCYRFDASALLAAYYDALSKNRPNNLFATTSALRDAHYAKHKANAFYHIQTINLPFPNIELSCDDDIPPRKATREPGSDAQNRHEKTQGEDHGAV